VEAGEGGKRGCFATTVSDVMLIIHSFPPMEDDTPKPMDAFFLLTQQQQKAPPINEPKSSQSN